MRTILPVVIGATLALCAVKAGAQAVPGDRQVALVIESKTLADALDQWAQQSGFQILLKNWDMAKKLTAPSLKGTFSAQAALEQLLSGTPLVYEFTSERTVTVRARVTQAVSTKGQLDRVDVSLLHLAALDAAEKPPARGSSAGPVERADRQSQAGRRSVESVEEVEEIVVTGTRLRRSRLESPVPITTFSRERIDQLGVSNVADLFTYFPQQSYGDATEGLTVGGARFASLRGLGVDTTLVLINGRRVAPSGPTVQFNAFDLNTLPLSAIDRVDVLSDSASAIYGADAVGGVVNIILKKQISSPQVNLHYGGSSGGATERRVSISGGFSTDRFHVSAVADFLDRDYLLGSEREYYANQDYTRFGSIDWRSATTNPANICSADGSDLPGLSSSCASVPTGSSGSGLTPSDFQSTAGTLRLDSLGRYSSIVPQAERRSVSAYLQFDASSDSSVFAEFLYSDRRNTSRSSPPALFSELVPASNPFNPFGVDLLADYLVSGVGPRESVTDAEMYRAVAGVQGDFRGWSWEFSVLRTYESGEAWTRNDVEQEQVAAAMQATTPDSALNVFQNGPGGSAALLRSLVATPIVDDSRSGGIQGLAFVHGALASLPAGDLQLALGGEWRREDMTYNSLSSATFIEQDRRASAAFMELELPIVSSSQAIPAMRLLTLTAAARLDDYSDFGDTFNPQFSVAWAPVSGVLFRASYGKSFRPPSLYELYVPQLRSEPVVPVTDPRRDQEPALVEQVLGGNPDLGPMRGTSITAGVTIAPVANPGLRIEATYWRIKLDDRVSLFQPQEILDNEPLFAEHVDRDSPTPADAIVGRPGRVLSIETIYTNFGLLETSGVDFNIAQSVHTGIGRFEPSLSATWVSSYRAAGLPGTPIIEQAGMAHVFGSIPRWKAVASLAWASGPIDASVTARYIPEYRDVFFFPPSTGRDVDAQTVVDMQSSLELGELAATVPSLAKDLKLTIGVMNLFNTTPSFAEVDGLGYDLSQGDLRKRFIYANLSKSF